MKKICIIFAAAALLILFLKVGFVKKENNQLTGSGFQKVFVSPTPQPTPNIPKTIKYDRTTNLKEELQKVNPQVLDSDFE